MAGLPDCRKYRLLQVVNYPLPLSPAIAANINHSPAPTSLTDYETSSSSDMSPGFIVVIVFASIFGLLQPLATSAQIYYSCCAVKKTPESGNGTAMAAPGCDGGNGSGCGGGGGCGGC